VQAGAGREGIALLKRLTIVIGIWHDHTGADGVTASKEGTQVGSVCDPQRSHDQMVRARNWDPSPLGLVVQAAVPSTHRVRMSSWVGADLWFMIVGLLGVRGPSLSSPRWYVLPEQESMGDMGRRHNAGGRGHPLCLQLVNYRLDHEER
jgi:hypothetical protein